MRLDFIGLYRPKLEGSWKSICICPPVGRSLPFLLSSTALLGSGGLKTWALRYNNSCNWIFENSQALNMSEHFKLFLCNVCGGCSLNYAGLLYAPVPELGQGLLQSMNCRQANYIRHFISDCHCIHHKHGWLGQNSSSRHCQSLAAAADLCGLTS